MPFMSIRINGIFICTNSLLCPWSLFLVIQKSISQNKKCKLCFLNLHNCEIITTFAAAKVAYRHFELYIDIQVQSVAPLNKRYKQNLSF